MLIYCAFDVGATGVATAHVYVIPNGGSVGDNTKLFDITLVSWVKILNLSTPLFWKQRVIKLCGSTGANINSLLLAIRRFDKTSI